MATLVFNRSSRRTPGEKRLAQRLQDKLPDNCLAWIDVPVLSSWPQPAHPDCVILDPSQGSILILEVKDLRVSKLQEMNSLRWTILVRSRDNKNDFIPKMIENPLQQARRNAHKVVQALEMHPELKDVRSGKVKLLWSYGVVLASISREQFNRHKIDEVLPPDRVICKDEMMDSVNSVAFQQRLVAMMPSFRKNGIALSKKEIDRVRWAIFPEVRISSFGPPETKTKTAISERKTTGGENCRFSSSTQVVDTEKDDEASHISHPGPNAQVYASLSTSPAVKVMDLQQEQLARNLGAGHRVVHGVAGSGKTMILIHRAEFLARELQRRKGEMAKLGGRESQVLVLCYNKMLSVHLKRVLTSKGLGDSVLTATFHKWCHDQLQQFNITKPYNKHDGKYWDDIVARVISAVESGDIPRRQFSSILVDEAHDFEPACSRYGRREPVFACGI